MIPDEAVQAARVKLEDVLGGWFDDLDAIRQILEAAAPYIKAQAIDKAADDADGLGMEEIPAHSLRFRAECYRNGAGIWHDPIVSIRTGHPIADTIYNMERASRDYSLPQKYVAGSSVEAKCCTGCPDCQGIPGPRPCRGIAETGNPCILDIGHGGLHK